MIDTLKKQLGNSFRLQGKTAVVTGAGRGLGKAIALSLAVCGADLIVSDVEEENLLKTCEEIKSIGVKVQYSVGDISNVEDVQELFGLCERIDIVVHNASIGETDFAMLDATPEQIRKIVDINITGSGYVNQIALNKMIPFNSGKLVNIASVGGRVGSPHMAYYRMGKAALINLTQSGALAGAEHNINVNAVCPGIVFTGIWEKVLAHRTVKEGKSKEQIWNETIAQKIPMGRPQKPEDIAYMVVFLCSDLADQITGQSINVCGGMAMN